MRRTFLFASIVVSLFCNSQELALYEKRYFNDPQLNLPYRYLRPQSVDSSKKYPLVIFLHGAFEKGFDNEAQLNIGGRFFLRDSVRENYPAYVLFPQCPETDFWAYFEIKTDGAGTVSEAIFPFRKEPTIVSSVLMNLLDSLKKADRIDGSRVYIGGLSQGAMGVLDLIARYPRIFAAAFSVCGAGNIASARNFAGKTALWLFHGDADDVVPPVFSQNYFKRLQKLKADAIFTEYLGVKHNSWVNAFSEPGLMYWLFSKRKYDKTPD